jgi:hypothetical protein
MAAGAATIYRNYFAPVAGVHGQTTERQFDVAQSHAEVGQCVDSRCHAAGFRDNVENRP